MEDIYLTQSQIDIIKGYYDRGPNAAGNYADAYTEIANMLPDSDVKLWFEGATQANAGVGIFSEIIRAYSSHQMALRGITYSDTLMQAASNAVATNALTDVLNSARQQPDGTWLFPTIDDIARNDAIGVGQVLFGSLGADTAGGNINAGWAGTILFSALGSNQTQRLTYGSGGSDLDTLDDLKNVLFAYDAYRVALIAARNSGIDQATSFDSQILTDIGISWDTFWSVSLDDLATLAFGSISNLLSGDAKLYGSLIEKAGVNVVFDWIKASYEGSRIENETSESEFLSSAEDFFNSISTAFQQSTNALLLPVNKQEIVSLAATNESVRNALYALSPIAISQNSYPNDLTLVDPQSGTGSLSETWLDKRASMMIFYKLYKQEGQTGDVFSMPFGLPVPIVGDVKFTDYTGNQPYVFTVDGVDGGIAETKEIVFGSDSVETIDGGEGDDFLFAMGGNDNILGSEGDDYIDGGKGVDVAEYSAQGKIKVEITSDGVVDDSQQKGISIGSADGGWLDEVYNVEKIELSTDDDSLSITGLDNSFLEDLEYIDLKGELSEEGDEIDLSEMSSGAYITASGDSHYVKESENSLESLKVLDAESISGSKGDDWIEARENGTLIKGNEGSDKIWGGDGEDKLEGGEGNDKLYGGKGNDELKGDDGSDIVAGAEGADTLEGGEGRDALGGGAYYDAFNDIYWLKDDFESDRLEGGSGYDFYFADTLDVISDSDGQGTIYFQSEAQGDLAGYEGGLWWRLGSAYETEYGSGVFESYNWWTDETLEYSLSGSTLSINGELSVEGYSDGDLGIRLVEKSRPNPPPLPNPPPTPASPLVLDLDGDGVETIGQDQGVHFDLDNSGFGELTGWVGQDDGLLALDKNNNGLIDNGAELFGNNTQLSSGDNAENGFVALADLDSNSDGVINQADDNFSNLKVWQDANSNGIADEGELKSLEELNIAELGLTYNESDEVDQFGNAHAQVGNYKLGNGVERELTDVWFDTNTQDNGDANTSVIPDDIAALPALAGAGNVSSLHSAMVADESGQLKSLVEQFSQATTIEGRSNILESILFQWVGETGDYEKHYQSLVDRRKIHTLEAFYGYELPDPRGGGWQYTELYERLFQQFSNTIYSQLVGQTHLKDYYDTIVYTSDNQGEATINFDALTEKLLYGLGDLTETASQELLTELYLMVDGLNPYEGTSFSNNEGQAILSFKQQVRDYIGTDVIDALFEGYIGKIDEDLEVKLRLSADRLLNFVAGATMYDDNIIGTEGNDQLNGLMGDDEIEAGAGDDIIAGGLGNDRLKGGLGVDQYVYNIGDGHDSIYNDSSDDAADSLLIHGVDELQLILNRQGDDLLIRFENGDGSIRVEGQFTGEGVNDHHIQEIILDD